MSDTVTEPTRGKPPHPPIRGDIRFYIGPCPRSLTGAEREILLDLAADVDEEPAKADLIARGEPLALTVVGRVSREATWPPVIRLAAARRG